MNEFTGERVIPGQVNDDLWAEHIARYAFAARYAKHARVLDIGCGSGYGTAELARYAASVVGIDIAPEAAAYAHRHFRAANAQFVAASATRLPFHSSSFDLATAFEVIEHLDDWQEMIREARRVLNSTGVLLVSTPNKLYYAESRAANGPNPFHKHEFEYAEFRDALAEFFPRVTILLQNRLESQAFYVPADSGGVDARLSSAPLGETEANFFLAVCSVGPARETRSFLYVPQASNLLREREQHIRLLEDELAKTKNWLAELFTDRQKLLEAHDDLKNQLEDHNRWALKLESDWKASMNRIVELQDQMQRQQAEATEIAAAYERTVRQLENENQQKTEWAIETEKRLSIALAAKCDELSETVRLLDAAEATVIERTRWAQGLDERLEQLQATMQMIRQSRWLKLGRIAHLGPNIAAPELPSLDRVND